jgi:transcriptional regulator with XRE-family HTH domain
MIGQKLRELRESKGLVQRQIAAELEVDTAYVSKIEGNEKPVSRHHLKKLSILLDVSEDELLKHWIADKLYDVIKNENLGVEALQLAKKYYIEQQRINRTEIE